MFLKELAEQTGGRYHCYVSTSDVRPLRHSLISEEPYSDYVRDFDDAIITYKYCTLKTCRQTKPFLAFIVRMSDNQLTSTNVW